MSSAPLLPGKPLDLFAQMRRDHRAIRRCMREIRGIEEKEGRAHYFRHLKDELLVHMMTEEKSLYWLLRNADSARQQVERAQEMNDDIVLLLKQLTALPADSSEWQRHFSQLESLVLQQFHHEEALLFELAQTLLPDAHLEALGDMWEDRKRQQRTYLSHLRRVA